MRDLIFEFARPFDGHSRCRQIALDRLDRLAGLFDEADDVAVADVERDVVSQPAVLALIMLGPSTMRMSATMRRESALCRPNVPRAALGWAGLSDARRGVVSRSPALADRSRFLPVFAGVTQPGPESLPAFDGCRDLVPAERGFDGLVEMSLDVHAVTRGLFAVDVHLDIALSFAWSDARPPPRNGSHSGSGDLFADAGIVGDRSWSGLPVGPKSSRRSVCARRSRAC